MKKIQSIIRSLVLVVLLSLGVAAEAKVITGTVTDETGETIISASIVVKGTTIGTVTDFDGNYTLDVPEDAQTLVFSYIGLQTQEVAISGNVINVVLRENSEVLEEVVVTGYGTTKKRDLVTSVASVGADQLKDIPVTSAAEALQGKLSGVSVTTTEGSPDADVKIRVRGGTSLTQSSDPLYIVDGFQVSSISDIAPSDIASMDVLKDAAATAIYGAQGANGVIIITTKDSKNDDDKFKFTADYTGYMGWKTMAKKYDMLDTDDFVLMQYEYAYLSKGKNNIATNFHQYFDERYAKSGDKDDLMSVADIQAYWRGQETDWQDATFGINGMNSNHNFSFNGGNKKVKFSFSYNRIDDQGIMYGSDYDRNNLSAKINYKPIKDLTLSFTARYANTEVWGAGTNTAQDAGSKSESRVRNAIAYSPIELFAKDNVAGLDDYESMGSLYDPITTIDHNYRHKVDNKVNVQGYIQYKFAKLFTWKTEVGYEWRDETQGRYYGPTSYYSRAGDGYTYLNQAFQEQGGAATDAYGYGHVVYSDYLSSRFREATTLDYHQKFNGSDHDLNILVGQEIIMNKGTNNLQYGYGYDKSWDGATSIDHLSEAVRMEKRTIIDPTDNMLSFFARANYILFSRYYLTATFRADASTRFLKSAGNQWGYFPSVAVAWRMIDEQWMEPAQEVMSNWKWRFSYGTAGNNNVDLGYLRPEYTSNTMAYMEGFTHKLTDGGADVIAANQNLKWETTITRDLGMDFGFFNERLTGTFDIYWNNTKDLILKYKLGTGGYNYQYRNIGSTENKGLEFSLNGVVLDKKSKSLSYSLSLNANISVNRNKVVDLGGMDEYYVSTSCFSSNYANTDFEYVLKPGSPVGDIYGYQSDGWWTPEDFSSYRASDGAWLGADGKPIETKLGKARPGMTKLAGEFDENGKYIENERVVLGNALPKFNGGFGLNFNIGGESWGKVDFAAQFTYNYGNDVLNLSALDYGTIFDKSKLRNNSASLAYGNRYSMFNADGSFIPAAAVANDKQIVEGDEYINLKNMLSQANEGAKVANPISDNIALTDQFVEDASFLRLSSLTLGYSLSPAWIKKAHIQTARIFFTASNLFCLTNYSGADPEVDTRTKVNPLAVGVDFSAFPKSRAFNFGLNLSF
ncbi:MAG: TonB-dependent receptor [Bacteroidales bacterium]|nr:TonB-dependent receptor [Candidatus Colicola faecequi]